MKKLISFALVLLTSLLVSCHKEEFHYSPDGSSIMIMNCYFSWTGNADGTISYDITSSNNEKSDKRGIRLFLDEKEVIALKESELPCHGIIPVKELGKHVFKFQVDIIEPVDNGTIGASMSMSLPLPFSVTFD